MKKVYFDTLPLWQFDNFSNQTLIKHFISGREGGFSDGDMGSLNLSYKVGDNPVLVLKNRTRISDALGVLAEKLIIPVQTHSNNCLVVTHHTKQEDLENTDAVITAEKGIMIAVMSADCVPIILYDQEKNVIAAIHAGWRGTVAEIVRLTIEKMTQTYNTKPSSIMAGIGPSISDEVYEVGKEVIEAIENVYSSKIGIISKEENGKGFCNLWEANRLQLIKAGVKPENIELAEICTYKNADTFFSYRKHGTKAGRFAAGILLK